MRIGITGAYGQFGWHLRSRLIPEKEIETVLASRETFSDPDKLCEFVQGLDAIIHLAGINRANDEQEISKGNPKLAASLVAALEATGAEPHVVYASTIHIDKDNVYGASKRQASERLLSWAEKSGAQYTDFVFPHLFGEYGRPNYNSAVSTFCHQVATGKEPTVHGDGEVELLHFNAASNMVLEAVQEGLTGQVRPRGTEIKVKDLAARILTLDHSYRNLVVPDLRDDLDLKLFNVYRGYLYPDFYPVELKLHSDDRGSLTEMVKSNNGGQTFFSTTKPGVTRGNHFHYHKVERFLVVKGKARISLRKVLTDQILDFDVSGDVPQFIDMPTLHTHSITNTGDEELVTLFWAHEIFDPEHPDTIFEPVYVS